MDEVNPLIENINKKCRYTVTMHPHCVMDDKVYYVCEIRGGNGVFSMSMDPNPKTALYVAQKSFKERAITFSKTFQAYMGVLNKENENRYVHY